VDNWQHHSQASSGNGRGRCSDNDCGIKYRQSTINQLQAWTTCIKIQCTPASLIFQYCYRRSGAGIKEHHPLPLLVDQLVAEHWLNPSLSPYLIAL